jgi:hypothetical protein
MLFARVFHRWRGLRTEDAAQQEISVPPEPVNALLSAALYLECLWLRAFNSPVGSSLLCLARKSRRASSAPTL